ncbi:hypothetical protein CHS0354_011433 [Potamilus streckersoni]|uniref:Uncharacterized protein n=1 Tax=Potamilus streckersoni TaxID=2493646 RepID=A0AAE0SL19_9BIVA|nr:hypothetical protein CHS0354_011433 [Potamilus streckersoni]
MEDLPENHIRDRRSMDKSATADDPPKTGNNMTYFKQIEKQLNSYSLKDELRGIQDVVSMQRLMEITPDDMKAFKVTRARHMCQKRRGNNRVTDYCYCYGSYNK